MKSSSFTRFGWMILFSASAVAAVPATETVTSSRTWTLPAGSAETAKWVQLLEATRPAGLNGVDQHFEGSVLTITYVRSGSTIDSLGTPGGGTLPPTGHPGDSYTVMSCNLGAKTGTTVEYVWGDGANGGAGGWIVDSSKTVYQASMTACPGT